MFNMAVTAVVCIAANTHTDTQIAMHESLSPYFFFLCISEDKTIHISSGLDPTATSPRPQFAKKAAINRSNGQIAGYVMSRLHIRTEAERDSETRNGGGGGSQKRRVN
jgi:hypothetical protein